MKLTPQGMMNDKANVFKSWATEVNSLCTKMTYIFERGKF